LSNSNAPSTFEKDKKPLGVLKWFVVIPILLLLALILGLVFIRAVGAILIVADPLKEADAAVALTGDQGDRITAAVDLYKSGYVDLLYITFTDPGTREMLINTAVSQGFPLQNIFVTEMQVSNTVDEALAVKQLALSKNVNSIIVITDPYHTLRTRVIFRGELRGSGISIQVRPVAGHWYRSNTWYKSHEGLRLTVEEYLKILLYYLGVN